MLEVFRFNDTLTDSVVNGDRELANEVERRLEEYLERTRPRFAVCSRTSNLSVNATTNTPLTLPTEDSDDENWHSTSSNTDRITPDVPGWYLATLNVEWQGGFSSTDRIIAILTKNGGQLAASDRSAGATATPDTSVSSMVYLNGSNDYVNGILFHGSGAARDVQGALSLVLVRRDV